MKMILTAATTPDEYFAAFDGWRHACAASLRKAVRRAVPAFEERLKWGHAVYFLQGPVLLIRVEPERVLFGFWRGKRLREIEPRLKAGGKYEMATVELREGATIPARIVAQLATEAANLDRLHGDPTAIAKAAPRRK